LSALAFVGFGLLAWLMSLEPPRRRAESAVWLMVTVTVALPLFGYDLRLPWRYLEEAGIAAGLALLLTPAGVDRKEFE
jgi:hypothetical protein